MPAIQAAPAGAPTHVVADLDRALIGPADELATFLDETDGAREEKALDFLRAGDRDGYLDLRLKESVAFLCVGRAEQAFGAAREVWVGIEGRASQTAQALALTQLAACSNARGDRRAALRAGRRAEALLAAEVGDDVPSILAVRAWLLKLLEEKGRDTEPVRERLQRTLAALARAASTPADKARLDRLRTIFVDSASPPHWALVHLRSWRF